MKLLEKYEPTRAKKTYVYKCSKEELDNNNGHLLENLRYVINDFMRVNTDYEASHYEIEVGLWVYDRLLKIYNSEIKIDTINNITVLTQYNELDNIKIVYDLYRSEHDVCSRRKRCLQRILSKEEADNQDHIRYTIDELIRIMRRDVDDDNPAHYKLALGCYVHRKLDFPKKYKDIRVILKTFSSLHYCANLEIRLTYDPNFVDYSSSVRVAKKHTLEEWKKAVKNYYKDESTPRINIKEILIDGPATIIFWDNGSKTVVKRDKQHDKKDNRREALILAILKKTNTSSYKIAKLYSNPNKDKRTLAEYLLRKSYPWNEDYGRKWLNNTVKLIKEQTNAGFSHVRIVFRDNKKPEIFVREVKI